MIKLPFKFNTIPLTQLTAKLQKRDRMALAAAAITVGLFIVLKLIVFPIADKRDSLHRDIKNSSGKLSNMLAMRQQTAMLTKTLRDTEKLLKERPRDFTLFSFLDSLAGKNGLKQNLVYMKPSTSNIKNSPYVVSMVEMKLQALTMQQLVTFLHGIETAAQQVWIKRMSISSGDKNERLLDSVLQVETYQL